MKVHIQILDAISGTAQSGCIEEPVQEGYEIQHTLSLFGVNIASIDWNTIKYPAKHEKMSNTTVKVGQIEGTAKIVTIVTMD